MDESMNLYSHPNWKALSTVTFRPKIFKKASETESQIDKNEIHHKIQLKNGLEAANVYKEILEMPSTSSSSKQIKQRIEKVPRKSKTPKVKFDKNLLFLSATRNDYQKIQEIYESNPDFPINCVDAFGWTPLMMSACEGALNSFSKLLEFGADLFIADKQGRTAKKLAQQKNHQHILEVIQNYEAANEESSEESDDEDVPIVPYFCKLCKLQFTETSIKEHENSTLHLYNYKSKINSSIKSFGIPRTNKGYKMMMRLGWDTQSGLGQEGRQGKLYPVKTTLRTGRSGLGIEQSAARVSHFGPHDLDAIKYRAPERAPTRKQIVKNYMNDRKLTRKLRDELS